MTSTRHNVIQTRASRSMMHYAFALALLLWGSTQGAIADESHPKLDPAVSFALAQTTDTSTVPVIVEAAPGKFAAVRAKVLATGKPIKAEHKFINALTVNLKKSDISSLESDPTVAHISLDHVVRSTAAAPPPPPPPPVSKPIDDVMPAYAGRPVVGFRPQLPAATTRTTRLRLRASTACTSGSTAPGSVIG